MYYIQFIYTLLLVGQTIKPNSFKQLIPGVKWVCGLCMGMTIFVHVDGPKFKESIH